VGISDGPYDIWAQAYDGIWGSPSARQRVNIDNTATVLITGPADGTFFIDPITIQTATTTGGSGVDYVEFFVDSVSIGRASSSPYQLSWQDTTCIARDTAPQQPCLRQITANIRNRAGVTGALSTAITVTDANAIIRGADRLMKQDTEGSFSHDFVPANLQYRNAVDAFLGHATTYIPVAIHMYERVLLAFPTHPITTSTVKRHLITAITRLGEGYVMSGNQRFVDALTGPSGGYSQLDINDAITKLDLARQNLDAALENYLSRFLVTLPAPYFNYWTLIVNEQPNHCDNYDSDYLISEEETYFPTCRSNRTPYWDWRLLGKAAGRKAFATRELAKNKWALGSSTGRDEAANLLAIGEVEAIGQLAFLESAIPGVTDDNLKQKIFATWRDLITEKNEMSRAIRYLAEGRNILGLKRQTVEFLPPRDGGDTRDNFHRHRDKASEMTNLAVASLSTLRQAARQFEANASNYLTAQATNTSHFNDLLSHLCGADFENRCDSGEIRQQLYAIDIAQNKVAQAQQEIDNANARYQNAIQTQFDEQRIRQATIQYVLDGIQKEEHLIDMQVELQKEAEEERGWFGTVTGIVQGVAGIILAPASGGSSAFLAAAAFSGSASSLSSGLGSFFGGGSSRAERQGEIDKQRVRLQALEKARIMEEGIELADLQYRTFIFNTRLDLQKLSIDLKGATLAHDQEVQQLANLFDQLSRAFTERENWRLLSAVTSDNFFRDPTLRMFRDSTLDGYARDQQNALWATYRAALALIYDMNTYAPEDDIQWGPLDCGGCLVEIQSPDDLLRMFTPDRLPASIATLTNIWDHFNSGAFQPEDIVVSTRLSWLLGFRDGPAGTASAQLHQYLLDNKTDDLDVSLTFPTNIAVPLRPEEDPEFAPVLGPFWANVKIDSIQAFILGGDDWTIFHIPFRLFLSYGLQNGGGDPFPVVGYMRRPSADTSYDPQRSDLINQYFYEAAGTATIQSGTGDRSPVDWASIPRNSKFQERALGLDSWGLKVCLTRTCQGDAETLVRSLDQIDDILFRFNCKGITLAAH
jgi:hypothetical protein